MEYGGSNRRREEEEGRRRVWWVSVVSPWKHVMQPEEKAEPKRPKL